MSSLVRARSRFLHWCAVLCTALTGCVGQLPRPREVRFILDPARLDEQLRALPHPDHPDAPSHTYVLAKEEDRELLVEEMERIGYHYGIGWMPRWLGLEERTALMFMTNPVYFQKVSAERFGADLWAAGIEFEFGFSGGQILGIVVPASVAPLARAVLGDKVSSEAWDDARMWATEQPTRFRWLDPYRWELEVWTDPAQAPQ